MTITNNEQNRVRTLRTLSNQDFLTFGIQNVAYVKPVRVDGKDMYAIHAADGTPLSVVKSAMEAFTTLRQNDLDPMTVH